MSQSQSAPKSKSIRAALIYPCTLVALLALGVAWFVLNAGH